MSELKPCPFCGYEPETRKVHVYPNGETSPASIKCKRCNYYLFGYNEEALFVHWNCRPLDVKQEAERNQFCPNCEAETPCTHEAELFVCDICGEDFAKYIVLRNCTLPDVSMTRDVTTPEPASRDEIITRLKEDAERLAATYVVEVFPHEWVCRGGCHHWARFGEQIDHAPDCPITLHRALMKELE